MRWWWNLLTLALFSNDPLGTHWTFARPVLIAWQRLSLWPIARFDVARPTFQQRLSSLLWTLRIHLLYRGTDTGTGTVAWYISLDCTASPIALFLKLSNTIWIWIQEGFAKVESARVGWTTKFKLLDRMSHLRTSLVVCTSWSFQIDIIQMWGPNTSL